MTAFLLFLLGFYAGGGVVTSITVHDIDGKPCTWRESAFVGILWWLVLIDASSGEDP